MVNIDNNGSKKIWTWVESLWANGTTPRDQGDEVSFKAGNDAAKVTISSIFAGLQAQTTDPLGMAVFPMSFDGTSKKITRTPAAAFDWGISSKSAHPKEAAMLLNFLLTDPEAVSAIGIAIGTPPAPEAIQYLSKNVYKEGTPENAVLQIVTKTMKEAEELWTQPNVAGWDEADDTFQTLLESYVFKKTSMEKFIADAQRQMNEKLAGAK